MKKIGLFLTLVIAGGAWASAPQTLPGTASTPAAYTMLSPGFRNFDAVEYGNPYSGNFRSILHIAPEIRGLKGVRLPVDEKGNMQATTLTLRFTRPVKLLVGLAAAPGQATDAAMLQHLDFHKGKPVADMVMLNALSVTELPAMDVYAVNYPSGQQQITVPAAPGFHVAILGAVPANQRIVMRDAEIKDETDYEAFYIEGFAEGPQVFSVIGGPNEPVVEEGMPGTEGIQGGFEGGCIVRVGDTYHMFPTERAGEIGKPANYDRVKTRIGHWTSTDAVHWTRRSTIVQATGVYALVHEDNPMNDRRSAIWSYMPIFSKEKNRWYGHYLAYTTDREISPNHSFGRIWRCESTVEGIEGIGGPYRDVTVVMEPGLDSQWWEGRQGVASFFPYQVGEGEWLGFFSGAYPFMNKGDYPLKSGKGWFVGLAGSDKLEGPWTRLPDTVNPTTSIHPWFVENPIVSRLPNGLYIAVFDGGPSYLKLPNQIAYTLSKDGYRWSRARYIPIDVKVAKWWDTMRTPLCLIPEGDDVYTIVYAAIKNSRRYHPMGMVRVKLDREALETVAAGLEGR
ncbi:MAG: hypothetical protein LBU80_03235 [Rikenellaceae bacterium]|jgi:hypothetical protein|nr:hypothetical protein [Rikenellaceae bacterium]